MIGNLIGEMLSAGNFLIDSVHDISGLPLAVSIFALVLIIYVYGSVPKTRYPPGPWGFPIVGHLPLLGKDPLKTLAKYRQTFGDVYSIQMGRYSVVVLSGIRVIRDALTKRPDEFAGRPQLHTVCLMKESYGGSTGLTFTTYSPAWKMHRKILNNSLRMFANYRKNPVEEIVSEEGQRLVDFMLSKSGLPFDPGEEIKLAAGSIIYQIMFGRHSNIREDEHFCHVNKNNQAFIRFTKLGNPVDLMSWTKFLFQDRVAQLVKFMVNSYKASELQIEHHQKTFHPADIRDVTDALLKAADNISPEAKQRLGLSNEQILSGIPDLQAAGFETVATTIEWALLYMANFPDVQLRVHSEIDKCLGAAIIPKYEDRKGMPYVEATILELLRVTCIAPLGAPHETTADVKLEGYFIPKGTFVLINLSSTCMDPDIWLDPDVFRPERFLVPKPGDNDAVSIDTNAADNFLVFGAGRRRCIGEFLAKVEIFVLFTTIMQRCSFSKVPGQTYNLEGEFGFTVKPGSYNIIAKARDNAKV